MPHTRQLAQGSKRAPAFFREGGKGGQGFPKLCPHMETLLKHLETAKLSFCPASASPPDNREQPSSAGKTHFRVRCIQGSFSIYFCYAVSTVDPDLCARSSLAGKVLVSPFLSLACEAKTISSWEGEAKSGLLNQRDCILCHPSNELFEGTPGPALPLCSGRLGSSWAAHRGTWEQAEKASGELIKPRTSR